MTTIQQKRRDFANSWNEKEIQAQKIEFFQFNRTEQRAVYTYEAHFRGVFINVSLLNQQQLRSIEFRIFEILTDKSLAGTHLYKKLADSLNIKRKLQSVKISANYSQLAESVVSSVFNTRELARLEVRKQREAALNARLEVNDV